MAPRDKLNTRKRSRTFWPTFEDAGCGPVVDLAVGFGGVELADLQSVRRRGGVMAAS